MGYNIYYYYLEEEEEEDFITFSEVTSPSGAGIMSCVWRHMHGRLHHSTVPQTGNGDSFFSLSVVQVAGHVPERQLV